MPYAFHCCERDRSITIIAEIELVFGAISAAINRVTSWGRGESVSSIHMAAANSSIFSNKMESMQHAEIATWSALAMR